MYLQPLVHITVQREAVMSLTSREYEHLRDSLESEVYDLEQLACTFYAYTCIILFITLM